MATVGLIGLVIDETHLLTMALDQLKVIASFKVKARELSNSSGLSQLVFLENMFYMDDLMDRSSPLEEEFQLVLQLIVELLVNEVCLLVDDMCG